MLIKNAQMLVTNMAMKEMQDRTVYCAVGLLSMDDGQKFDLSVREQEIYTKIKPMVKIKANLDLTNSKYGMKLAIKELVEVGTAI